MFNYANSQNTAYRLIDKFGANWTHRKLTKNTYNPATNTRTTTATGNTTVRAVRQNYGSNQVDGQVIKQGDVKLLAEAKSFTVEPDVSDLMLDGSETWQIMDVKPFKPGDTIIYYELQLRQ